MSRLAGHAAVSAALAALPDQRLAALVRSAVPGFSGIGGPTATVEVAGVPVFVKQVPLTALELAHPHSTANLFGLPEYYQYGIGSTGFGAWRELAAHLITTGWVLAGEFAGFPLLYHWRVLPRTGLRPATAQERDERERAVADWGGSAAVRERLVAVREAPAALVLFMEALPQRVHDWLRERIAAGAGQGAFELVERQMEAAAGFLGSRGLLHFDAHFHNVLADGERLYFADLGLAMHAGFAYSPAEEAFFDRHCPSDRDLGYDRAYLRHHLCRWLVTEFLGAGRAEVDRLLVEAAAGMDIGLPPAAAAVVARHAPVAAVMSAFFRDCGPAAARRPTRWTRCVPPGRRRARWSGRTCSG